MGELRMALWVLLLGGAALAQTPKPSMAVVPLEIEPHPSLKRFEPELRAAWFDGLRDSGKLLLPTRRELEAAYTALKRQDCRESNECMTQLAVKAGTLYAIYAEVGYSEGKVVSVTARVVRDDGKLMGSSVVQAPKGTATIVDVAKRLFIETFEKLKLTELPTFKEVTPDPLVKKDPDPVITPPDKKNDLPPPPPPPLIDTGKGQRTAGTALLIGGAAGFAVGVALTSAGLGMGYGADLNRDGNVDSPARVNDVLTGQALSTTGFIVGGVGAVAAGLGAVLTLTAAAPPKASVTVVPVAGGGVVQIGGQF